MQKYLSFLIIILCLQLACTKEVEKIIYPEGDPNSTTGSIVGLVIQKDSDAKVIVRQATVIDSTFINPLDGQFRLDDLQVGNYDLSVKAPYHGTYWIRNVMVHGGGVTYVGEISLSNIPDLVESIYPEDQSEVVFDRLWSQLSVSISFTTAMDRESVEQAFSTDPPSEGVFYWGAFASVPTPRYFWDEESWMKTGDNSGATITTYSKVKAFTYRMAQKDCYTDTTYTIILSTTAKDTAGTPLEFPLQFKFSTVQSASTQNAILTQPAHGDIYVDPLENNSIYMTFPRRMDQASVENSITITPYSDVIFLWPSGNKLKIYTGGPLVCEVLYQIHLPETALDLDGIALGEPFDFSFETAPVAVESVSPQSGEIFVSRNSKIRFTFNTYMILSSVKDAFSIVPGMSGTFIRGYDEYNNNQPKDVITFIPSNLYASNTKYTVTLSTSAYDLHGTNLKEAYNFAFVTEPE
jgi:hypothetical protein